MIPFLWFGLSIAVGVAASRRYGRDGGAWWFLSLFISPVLGFALLAAAGPKAKKRPKLATPPPLPSDDLDAVILRLRGGARA